MDYKGFPGISAAWTRSLLPGSFLGIWEMQMFWYCLLPVMHQSLWTSFPLSEHVNSGRPVLSTLLLLRRWKDDTLVHGFLPLPQQFHTLPSVLQLSEDNAEGQLLRKVTLTSRFNSSAPSYLVRRHVHQHTAQLFVVVTLCLLWNIILRFIKFCLCYRMF